MKNKKTKFLLGTLLAFSLALSFGSFAKGKSVEPVSAESLVFDEVEEDPNISSSPEDPSAAPDDSSSSSEETPIPEPTESGEESPASEESGEAKGESAPADTSSLLKDVFGAIVQAFKDAWADLVAHLKNWLKRS